MIRTKWGYYMERDVFVDRLKGYACFLVVFGHVILGVRNAGIAVPQAFPRIESFIWSFHVALFLFLSGYVYKLTGEWKSKKTRWEFIGYKLINLGVPYVLFSIIYILLNSLTDSSNMQSDIGDVFLIWKTPVAQYWFLYALFFLFCIWALLSAVTGNRNITVAVVLIGYIVPALGGGFGSLGVAVYSALAFGLGTFAEISGCRNCGTGLKVLIIVFHLLVGYAAVRFGVIEFSGIKEAMLILGIYASIMFVSLIERYRAAAGFLDFMNRYLFQTYLLHTIFTAGIRVMLLKLGITNWVIHVICGCVFGIGMSSFSAWVAEKTVVLNICFFPTKTLKKIYTRTEK